MTTDNESKGQRDDMEARLWAYLDGHSGEDKAIEDLLAENREWQEKYGELLELHTLMKGVELEQPSLRFTKNVMEEIARYQIAPAAKAYINTKIVWGIAAFFMTVILGFLVYGFSQVEWSSGSGSGNAVGIDFSAVDYSKMFSNTLVNGFMILNIVLGLFLLDRYLSLKRKEMREG